MFKIRKNKITLFIGFTIFCLIFQSTAFGDSPKDVSSNLPFPLKVKETADIDSELKLTVLDGIEDSRCPSDVTCIWEGNVSVKVNLIKGDQNIGNHTIQLETIDGDEQNFDGYFIRLINVEPYPKSNTIIESSDYVMTFLVSKMSETQIDSPLKQFKTGVPINKIQCKPNLVIIIKSSDSSPACVRSSTAEKLFLRGWTEIRDTISIQPIIKTGTFAGYCIGYCTKEFTITPEKIIYSQNGRDFVSGEWSDLLEKTKVTQLSQSDWNNLIDLIDFREFNSLPDQIGCPGCADAPVEWIEISYGDKTKKIQFEHDDKIPEISELIMALHEIRNKVELSIDNFEECVSAGNAVMESYPRQCRTADGQNFVEDINSKLMSHEALCQKHGGNWIQEFNECETVSEDQCSTMNGVFYECESACRHIPESTACTLQCVQVCVIP